MTDSAAENAIESLIADLRRTLWLGQLQRAVRAALWAWAVIMTTGAILHALAGQPGFVTTLAVGGAAWLVALLSAALQRPETEAAALHADRRLGGQSACSTWLEARSGGLGRPESPAARRLLEWTAAAVPSMRDELARRRTSWQLLRPAAAAVICTALAIAVTMLGGSRPAPGFARDRPAAASHAATEAPMLDESALVETLATELAARDGDVDTASAAGEREPRNEGRGATSSAVGAAEAVAGEAGTKMRLNPSGATSAPGGGREAGSTRDDSTPGPTSRAATGPLPLQRRDVSGLADDVARLADDERVASFAHELMMDSGPASAAAASAAAARPPAARHEALLSPAEGAYVASWRAESRPVDQEQ